MNESDSTIPWVNVCDCTLIPMDDQKSDRIARLMPAERNKMMEAHYLKHKQLLPNADCPDCDGSGDKNYWSRFTDNKTTSNSNDFNHWLKKIAEAESHACVSDLVDQLDIQWEAGDLVIIDQDWVTLTDALSESTRKLSNTLPTN